MDGIKEYNDDLISDSIYLSVLKRSYNYYKLFNGTLNSYLNKNIGYLQQLIGVLTSETEILFLYFCYAKLLIYLSFTIGTLFISNGYIAKNK